MYRWNLTNGKMWSKQKRCQTHFPEEIWNDLHYKLYGMEENIPGRGWDLEKDIITKTIGRKTVLDTYYKNKFH
jgi:endonuclease-3